MSFEYRLIIYQLAVSIDERGDWVEERPLTVPEFEAWLNGECVDGWAVKLCLEYSETVKKFLLERVRA